MISVTLTYTDNLGPEADIPLLLRKLAVRLNDAVGAAEPLLVGATRMTDYVTVGEEAWEHVVGVAVVPAARAQAFRDGLLNDLFGIAESHFVELYPRRNIALSFALRTTDETDVIERRHRAPPTADSF